MGTNNMSSGISLHLRCSHLMLIVNSPQLCVCKQLQNLNPLEIMFIRAFRSRASVQLMTDTVSSFMDGPVQG